MFVFNGKIASLFVFGFFSLFPVNHTVYNNTGIPTKIQIELLSVTQHSLKLMILLTDFSADTEQDCTIISFPFTVNIF